MPLSPHDLLARFDELGIETTTVEHPAVYTVEQAKQHRVGTGGVHTKNLFLRNKKKRMWLVTTLEDRAIDLKALGRLLQAGNLSFGSADRLRRYLGIEPGSVTPLAVVNDEDHEVTVVVDRALLEGGPIHCHPLTNTMTTEIAAGDLVRFLEHTGHPPRTLDLSGCVPQG